MREVGGVADALGEPVAVMGFCLGGAVSFACAQVEGVRAAVPFYGVPAPSRFEASRVLCPIQAHFAATDPWASPEKGRALQEQVLAAGGRMALHVYEGTVHAFTRASDPKVFHPTWGATRQACGGGSRAGRTASGALTLQTIGCEHTVDNGHDFKHVEGRLQVGARAELGGGDC